MKKILIILISSFFALIFFEFFLSFSPFKQGISATIYDSKLGMWHKKNFENYIIEECYENKYSYNDKGIPSNVVPYNSNKKDVILLGDSNIEAQMVKNENIIHNSLAKEFNYKYNFMNYGLFGSSPIQQLIILKEKVDLKNTKYVLQFIDIEGDLKDVDSKNLSSLSRPKVFMKFENLDDYTIIPPRERTLYDIATDALNSYQIYLFIKKTIYFLKDKISNKNENENSLSKNHLEDKKNDMSKNWLYLKGAIYQINKYIKSVDNTIKYKIVLRSKSEEHKSIMRNFLNDKNIEFIFLNETAKSMNIELKSFTCDSHWNDKSHQDIAKIIKHIELIR